MQAPYWENLQRIANDRLSEVEKESDFQSIFRNKKSTAFYRALKDASNMNDVIQFITGKPSTELATDHQTTETDSGQFSAGIK